MLRRRCGCQDQEEIDHLKDLRMVFDKLWHYNLKMNPLKCAFGVTSGKFLGFIIKHRGIEVDQSKIKAIQSMPEAKEFTWVEKSTRTASLHQALHLQPCWTLSTLQSTHEEDASFIWDYACRNAFESIKKYLASPPVLGAPVPGKPFILYIVAQEGSIGALLAQENEDQKERALYYLSRTLTGAELNYSLSWEDVPCLSLCRPKAKTLHACLHHPLGC